MKFVNGLIFIIGLTISHHAVSSQLSTQFESLVQRYNIKKVEHISPLLVTLGINNVTWAFDTRALLGATPTYLRPVFWDVTSGIVITYKSHSMASGPDTIEALEWNKTDERIRLLEMDLTQKKPKWTEPRKCAECHGDNSRPIWDEYPVWPGFIGSNDDFLDKNTEEYIYLKEFLNENKNNLRTEFVSHIPSSTEIYRTTSDVADLEKSLFSVRPNMRLGKLLQRINAKRIISQIKGSNNSDKLNLLYLLLECKIFNAEDIKSILTKLNLTTHDFFINFLNDEDVPSNFLDSYTDGSATINEMLITDLIRDLLPEYKKRRFIKLTRKHSLKFPDNQIDSDHFSELDAWGDWFPLPFENNELNKIRKRFNPPKSYIKLRDKICSQIKYKQI